MKNVISFAALVLATLTSMPSMAASEHDMSHGAAHAMPAKTPLSTQMATGQIKKIDKSAAKVTIAHGPLENLGMPAMTMVFRVKNTEWLSQLKDGDKIRFLAENVDGALTVTQYEPAK